MIAGLGCLGLVVGLVLLARAGGAPRPSGPSTEPSSLRIVALSPALAITARDLGYGPAIVGRHGFDYVLDKDLPICGDQQGIDYERLLAVQPTHVLLEWGRRPLPARLVTLAERRGWRLLDYDLLTLEQVRDSIEQLPRDLGAPDDANVDREAIESNARELLARADAAWAEDQIDGARRSVLILWPTTPMALMGPGSFHQQILERVGGRPAVPEGASYMEVEVEDILDIAPGGIILLDPAPVGGSRVGATSWEELTRRLGPVASLDIPAIRERRVALIDHPLALTGSTAMIDVSERMMDILEAWEESAPEDAE